MPEALFTREGNHYVPTSLTVGPWSPEAQHGGPPAALLAGAIEKTPSDVEMTLARVTIDLLKPVSLEPVQVETEIVRPGRRVQLVASSLEQGGELRARAFGLKIRSTSIELPAFREDEPIPGREHARPVRLFDNPGAFAAEATEILMVNGDFSEPGPGTAWLRLRVPLIEGEEPTGVERVAAAADFGNGVSNLAGTVRGWSFINPDLEIRMTRPPVGEWVYLDSRSRLSATGAGLATSVLGDDRGVLGVAAQSLYVDRITG